MCSITKGSTLYDCISTILFRKITHCKELVEDFLQGRLDRDLNLYMVLLLIYLLFSKFDPAFHNSMDCLKVAYKIIKSHLKTQLKQGFPLSLHWTRSSPKSLLDHPRWRVGIKTQ